MEYIVGILLGLATGAFATGVGFDRSRSFYPVVLVVVASYYCLFAAIGGSSVALWLETVVALIFAGIAIAGFRMSLWMIVAALAAHGAMDLVHSHLIENAGVPGWWPGFCFAFDVAAAIYLAICIALRGEPEEPPRLGMAAD